MSLIKRTPADIAFSICVRERAGWKCERCHVQYPPKTQALHCSHYFSRGNWGTRFDPDNCMSLCYGCHEYLDRRNKGEYENLMLKWLGGYDQLNELSRKAHSPAKGLKKAVSIMAKHFRNEAAKMALKRSDGAEGRLEFAKWEAVK